jgi:hypothetical protein
MSKLVTVILLALVLSGVMIIEILPGGVPSAWADEAGGDA